jgi:hypothetical protein
MANQSTADLGLLLNHQEFLTRIRLNLGYIANQIASEDDSAPYALKRKPFAKKILNGLSQYVYMFAENALTQPGVYQYVEIDPNDSTKLVYTNDPGQTPSGTFDGMDVEIQAVLSAIFNNLC